MVTPPCGQERTSALPSYLFGHGIAPSPERRAKTPSADTVAAEGTLEHGQQGLLFLH